MSAYSLDHLSDDALLGSLAAALRRDRASTADVLAHIAEVDARRLYLPAAHPSMFSYCVHVLRLSEDAAYKRIQAGRAARDFPVLFEAIADGRLHLTGVGILAPHLTAANVEALIEAATHRTKAQIEQLIAERFPQTESFAMVMAVPGSSPVRELVPGQVRSSEATGDVITTSCQLAPAQVGAAEPRSKVAPVAAERFLLQVTIGRSTHDKLEYARGLLAHAVPSGDLGEVLDRSLDALIAQLEKRKCAATSRPQQSPRETASPRHIPASVKRAVWARDGARCTFVDEDGRRCPARGMLEFDHIEPVARGGRATEDNLRLRCRAHNQHEAERAFGAEFMENKRSEAREAAEARSRAAAAAEAAATSAAAAQTARATTSAHVQEQVNEVVPYLRSLRFRPDECRRAAALCEEIPDAPLEERVRRALSYFRPRGCTTFRPAESRLARVASPAP